MKGWDGCGEAAGGTGGGSELVAPSFFEFIVRAHDGDYRLRFDGGAWYMTKTRGDGSVVSRVDHVSERDPWLPVIVCRDCDQDISACHDGACREFGDAGEPFIEDERAIGRYLEVFGDAGGPLCIACHQNRRDTAHGR